MIAFLCLLLYVILPDADVDGDGYGARVEYLAGCSPFDRESLPYCLPGNPYPASCGASIPGADLTPCPP